MANKVAKIVARNRARHGRENDPDDLEAVGRARIHRSGDQHGLPRQRNARALESH